MKTTLYKLNNSNRISWWTIEALDHNNYKVSWGQDHKNMSISNNTQISPGDSDAINSKLAMMIARKGYSRDVPTTQPDLPMLAQTYKDYQVAMHSNSSSVEPFKSCYVQPKYDGIRCLSTVVSMMSRRNTPIRSCPHVEIALENLLNDTDTDWSLFKFDGELYIEGADLQTTQSAVRGNSYHPMLWSSVKYVIFDIVDTELPFHARREILNTLAYTLEEINYHLDPKESKFHTVAPECIQVAPTHRLSTTPEDEKFQEELNYWHTHFVFNNYEGTIIRNGDSMYRLNYRSFDLLKYKDFLDAEYEIVEVVAGKDDCAIFVCKTTEGRHFRVSPSFPKTRKQQILIYKSNYIGKQLVVKYEKLSAEGVPLKPIGVTIL